MLDKNTMASLDCILNYKFNLVGGLTFLPKRMAIVLFLDGGWISRLLLKVKAFIMILPNRTMFPIFSSPIKITFIWFGLSFHIIYFGMNFSRRFQKNSKVNKWWYFSTITQWTWFIDRIIFVKSGFSDWKRVCTSSTLTQIVFQAVI